MADQSWFFASQGQQQGPYPEAQLRQFIASRVVNAETLVWTEGMANWQKAGDVPGLLVGAGPPATPQSGGLPMSGGSLSIDFGLWDFIWRSFVLSISFIFVIPLPWAMLMYCRWIVSCVRVPQRPNLGFTGRAVDLMWFYVLVLLVIAAIWTNFRALNLAVNVAQLVLYWLLIKWFIANLSSNGQPLGLHFSGSFWGFFGWSLLAVLSIITIVGWAWVYVAQLRWMCRHVEGTRRDVVFNGTGLEFLWRVLAIVLGFAAAGFIAVMFASLWPEFLEYIVGFALFLLLAIGVLPWAYRWQFRWLVSQIGLVERHPQASA